jgi:hypothetical protein
MSNDRIDSSLLLETLRHQALNLCDCCDALLLHWSLLEVCHAAKLENNLRGKGKLGSLEEMRMLDRNQQTYPDNSIAITQCICCKLQPIPQVSSMTIRGNSQLTLMLSCQHQGDPRSP